MKNMAAMAGWSCSKSHMIATILQQMVCKVLKLFVSHRMVASYQRMHLNLLYRLSSLFCSASGGWCGVGCW